MGVVPDGRPPHHRGVGSDDKEGDHYGATATQVWAEQLSRPALIDAIDAGHAYVQARGVADSPTLVLTATAPDGTSAMFGDTLVADTAEITLTVRNGEGQSLRVLRNGDEVEVVAIDDQVFDHTFTADRAADEGPLGTFWGIETFDAESITTIANPVFLADRPAGVTDRPAPAPVASGPSGTLAPVTEEPTDDDSSAWWPWVAGVAVGFLIGVGVVLLRRRPGAAT